VAAGFAALFGGVLARPPAAPADALAVARSVADLKAGFALNASTTSLVQSLQATLRASPKDEHSWVLLGLAYRQRARETGDPAYYSKSGAVLDPAQRLDVKDTLVFGALGSLALSRHRFALRLGREARALAPRQRAGLRVIGDAELELGRYRLAFRDFDAMDRLRPDLSSYARVSYGRELLGHTAAAIRAMNLALDAAADTAEPLAWTHVQLGKLYFNHGRYRLAERELETANAIFPRYAYGLDALALDEAALGRTSRAVALERQAVDLIPLPQCVAALGDLDAVTGKRAPARRQYATIGVIERLLRANGVRVDLEIAQFDVDHGLHLRHALALARNGRCRAALGYSRQALRLGTQDAAKFFHRGMIERCGRRGASRTWFRRALALNPHFSILWAPVARTLATNGPNRTGRSGE
jgi:tetratricopeptide (TPR) repeat protein